ncbi:MAG: preprotein translocase subunit YajC [Verrucomicrobia bacterium]|nr:preprotein translocase subunit YajC [Pseudomonadota bacterium]NBS06100.1 preprotein translocase subunit YajC [Verrucomicrobiota bacterium]NBS78728.1 preprotein translocase subunit YajC [bacterium]NBS49399.1 preprotein translocase subunit YajC [Verrucomicrobiota bacterium]NBT23285.1 preprotein translocase subunit YajC [bacterium]
MMVDLNWVGHIPLLMAPPPADGTAPPAWVQILPLAILFVLMYFVLLRPQMKRQKETEKLIQSVKTGDRVLAAGGIYGTVANLKDAVVLLKVADNVKIEVLRSSITSVEKVAEEKSSS